MSKPSEPAAHPMDDLPPLQISHLPFPVVGLGASAGGLQALIRFFEATPEHSGMAYVVVMHLSPDHESHAGDILQKATDMPVLQIDKPVPLQADHVYVIPPGKYLTMNDGYLRLSEPDRRHGRQVAIDLFFRTLADVHQHHAFGIVLSGAGADGSVGLVRVKEQGGVTLVQDPQQAEYDSMPNSAIATGQIDFVLPVEEMPARIVQLWREMRRTRVPGDPGEDDDQVVDSSPTRADLAAMREIIASLRARTGHDFKHYKRATILRRMERRMQVNGQPNLQAYRDLLRDRPEETQALLGDLLIGVTNFFRDPEAFEALEREVIPELFGHDGSPANEVRVWCAGCSTGEEAYSLAMLLCQQSAVQSSGAKLQVFATDIDERAISTARIALYPESIVTDVPSDRLQQFFVRESRYFRVRKEVREKVLFAQHSLLRDPPFSRLDLISCRNLLIYLDRSVQQDILRMFHFALRPGGYLMLGSSESADACPDLFTPVDKKNRLYRARIGALSRHTPIMPSEGFLRPTEPLRSPPEVRRRGSFAELHQQVLELYAPPSMIVNRALDIVHMSDRAGHFLRYAGGEPTHNVLKLIAPELRLELRTALFQAIHSKSSVEARRAQVERDGRPLQVNMVVRPFTDEQGQDYILVLFDEVDCTLAEPQEPRDPHTDRLIAQLEDELQRTKEQLQATIEQAETSTEELKASNEELQAINEELRSATEELETSKEELQSINEELTTVNHELKAKVEETSKINDDLQNLIASTDIATVFVDRGLRIKWYTPRATDIFSIIASDAGRSLLDITHRLAYPELADDAAKVFESLGQIEREVRSRDGRWYIARLLPYRTNEDRIDGAVLTFIEITARRQAEEKLREEEELMRLVADSTSDYAIITMDTEGLVTSWNRGAERIFGHTQAEVIGKSADVIFLEEDRMAGAAARECERALAEGRAEDERWHRRKDGTHLYCSGVVSPLGNGEVRGYVKIARDLTQRKRQEMAQETKLERSKASSLRKDQFFAVVSHELKHPLNLIQLNAELLSRIPVIRGSASMNKAAQAILQGVRSQAQIIDDLLDVSRVRTGKLKLKRTAVELDQVIDDILRSVRSDIDEAGLHVDFIGPAEGGPTLDADSCRVEQIAWNLINNAVKFTPAGGQVTIRCEVDGTFARLDVSDDGRGIDPEFLPLIFDLFGQADGHALRHKDGLGIGLALVRQLAEAHGGRVQAYSEGSGRGTRFSVWLPLLEVAPAKETTPAADDESLVGTCILLVDDSPDVRETLQALLELEGATVVTAGSGPEALERLDAQGFDLMLSDIGMPGMDGHQLMEAVRARPHFADLPGIALTGYGSADDVKRASEAGFDGHLGKPVSFEALVAKVREVLAARRRDERPA